MARVDADEVRAIMPDNNVGDDPIDAMIISAEEMVTQVFAGDSTVTATLLKEIERWLVAHMVTITFVRTTTEEGIGDVRVKYAGTFGKSLESTPYGQMVLTLDTTGKMARSGKAVASMFAIPTIKEDE